MPLVTIEQVNIGLRLSLDGNPPTFISDPRTPDVELKIAQAEAVILGYLKEPADKWVAGNAPAEVTAAIILAVRGLYDGEDKLLAGLYDNDRTNPIVGLLQRLRSPALA